jgi:hypothetical protein
MKQKIVLITIPVIVLILIFGYPIVYYGLVQLSRLLGVTYNHANTLVFFIAIPTLWMILVCANFLKLKWQLGLVITIVIFLLYYPFIQFIYNNESELVKLGYDACHYIFTGKPYSLSTAYSKYLIQYVLGSIFLCIIIPLTITTLLIVPLFKLNRVKNY